MLLMIDNYDSFTFNLVQYFGELGAEVKVVRNDELGVAELEALAPSHVVLSPGPCTPNEAGITLQAIERLAGRNAAMPSSVIASLRNTRTSSPSSPKYCTRLKVKES